MLDVQACKVLTLSPKERVAAFGWGTPDSDALQIMIDGPMHGCTRLVSIPRTIPEAQLISMTIMLFDSSGYSRLGLRFVGPPAVTSI